MVSRNSIWGRPKINFGQPKFRNAQPKLTTEDSETQPKFQDRRNRAQSNAKSTENTHAGMLSRNTSY